MKTFVFVYNAQSGKINALIDTMHKIFSPKTYACNLCMITYGTLSIKKTWKEFIEQSPHTFNFYHIDEFENIYPDISAIFPCVFILENQSLKFWLASDKLNQLNLEGLMQEIRKVA